MENKKIVHSFLEEEGEIQTSGMTGNKLFYWSKYADLLDEAVNRKLITREEANGWDVRCSNNLLNVLGYPSFQVEADEQTIHDDKDEEMEWIIYWN